MQLEHNYYEAIRLLRTRLAQFHYDSQEDKDSDQVTLAFFQHFAGDTAGEQVSAEKARKTLEQFYRDHPGAWGTAANLSDVYALIGDKDSALQLAERAIMLVPAKDPLVGSDMEENLAVILAMLGEHTRAIAILRQLLQTPCDWPITPALLRLNPIWDPLRADPAFQKLCDEKQPPATR